MERYNLIHFIEGAMYAKDILDITENHLKMFRHSFLCGQKLSDQIITENKSEIFNGLTFQICNNVFKSKIILLHGLFSYKRILFLFIQPWLWKKCVWIVWGGDLYIHQKYNKTFIEKIAERMKQIMIPSFLRVCTIVNGDFDLVKQWYNYKGKYSAFKYPIPLMRKGEVQKFQSRINVNNIKPRIVIGNSATRSNNHCEIIDVLKGMGSSDFELFIPLTYGDKDYETYKLQVITYACNSLGQVKVRPILQSLSGEEYNNLMRTMNVAIYNNDRQQAMGNISIMLAAGVKVYLREGTTMWNHYKSKKFKIFSINDLKKAKFENMICYSNEDADYNANLFFQRNSIDKLIGEWGTLFKELCEEKRT